MKITDKERLDFIVKNKAEVYQVFTDTSRDKHPRYWVVFPRLYPFREYSSFPQRNGHRAAIDAAIRAQRKEASHAK